MSAVVGSLLYDEYHTLKDGSALHLTLDALEIQTLLEEYTTALQHTRLIPFDLQHLSPSDPIIRYLLAQGKDYKDAEILSRARAYYARLLVEAQSNAFMLALFSADDNVFTNTPKPYERTVKKALPGVLSMPEIEKDLNNETEYRLKQLLDLMIENPEILSKITDIIESFSVRFNRMGQAAPETDKLGFQPGAANGSVSEDPQPGSVQQKASKKRSDS